MANTYSTELAPTQTVPADRSSALAGYDARVRRYRASITLASQASGDTITLCNKPAGYTFAYGVMGSDTSLGSTTVAIGNSTTAAKYKAAATFTATDTPTLFGKAAAVAETSPTAETVLATLGAATAPSSGQLVIDLYFSAP